MLHENMAFGNKDVLLSPEGQGCMVLLNEKGPEISFPVDEIKAADTSYHRNRMTLSTFGYRTDFFL